jgi:sugar lactone lactonase YvrE
MRLGSKISPGATRVSGEEREPVRYAPAEESMKKSLAAAGVLALAVGVLAGPAAVSAAARTRASGGGACVRIAAHFDFRKGRTPENLALEPDGAVDVTFSVARQVARVDLDGARHVLATMPLPADGGVHTPVLKFAATMGVVRDQDGTLYFLYAAGSSDLTGVWRLRPHGRPERIAALPADGLPNGLALDDRSGELYVADSALGTVWTVPVTGGTATAWSTAPELARDHYMGANGIKVHDHAVWVSNTDQGTIVRIPLLPGGRSGPARLWASGLTSVDDFAFTGRGEEILAALNEVDTVVGVESDGTVTTVLDAADGLRNPSAVAVRADTVYVASAAYKIRTGPNLLLAHLDDPAGAC